MAPQTHLSFFSPHILLLLLLHLSLLFLTSSADILQSSQISAAASTPTVISFAGTHGIYRSMSQEFLSAHNTVRATENEKPLVWDRQVARFARRWAEALRAECRMEHSMGPYGENLFWGLGWSWRPSDAVREWAREKAFYNPVDNSCAAGRICGHFTQIIWNDTLRIGCGRSECDNGGGVIITCNYDPPGNYVGERPLSAGGDP